MLSILQRQKNLKYFGNRYKGALNGKSSPQLKMAVKSFNKVYGIKGGATYSSTTNSKLIAKIKQVQKALYYLGYFKCKKTGVINKNDIAAIKSIQRKYKLPVTGVINTKTWKKIKALYRKKKAKKRYCFQKMNGQLNWKFIDSLGFDKTEFKCHCNGRYCKGYPHAIDPDLIYVLVKLRKKYGTIQITSGLRCKRWNAAQTGSASTSRHMYGKAADFVTPKSKASKQSKINYCYRLKHVKYSYSNNTNMGSAVHVNV